MDARKEKVMEVVCVYNVNAASLRNPVFLKNRVSGGAFSSGLLTEQLVIG